MDRRVLIIVLVMCLLPVTPASAIDRGGGDDRPPSGAGDDKAHSDTPAIDELDLTKPGGEPPNTAVILLGSGTPNPDPDRSGCAVAVVVGATAYLVDFGPGVVRSAARLSADYGGPYAALNAENLEIAFLTHLHSDHTVGYPDLIFTPWVMGRDAPLQVYGPEGIGEMTDHILKAYAEDIRYRLFGLEPANDRGWRVKAHEIGEGVVYRDRQVKVEAFRVRHGSWPNAFGFRFTTPDKVVVISGDTAPCANVVRFARGADILVHEVYSAREFTRRDAVWRTYHAAHHTSTVELGEMADAARPGLLVLYHVLAWGAADDELLAEVATRYDGKAVVGSDLDVFD